jgi:hypothetical protein
MGSDLHEKLIHAADALADRIGAPRVRETSSDTCGCGSDEGKAAKILPVLAPGGGTADDTNPDERPVLPSGL